MTRHDQTHQTFYCDHLSGCNVSYEDEGSPRLVWSDARTEGWRRGRSGTHYCPTHATGSSDRVPGVSE